MTQESQNSSNWNDNRSDEKKLEDAQKSERWLLELWHKAEIEIERDKTATWIGISAFLLIIIIGILWG